MIFTYQIHRSSGEVAQFVVDSGRPATKGAGPDWTQLTYHRCSSCPLAPTEHSYCPAALDLVQVVEAFADALSTEQVNVYVKSLDRDYLRSCDLQTALRSIVGLLMSTSACPILSQLQVAGHFHLPFSNRSETVFRVVSTYLLKQYFVALDGGIPDLKLDGLSTLYTQISRVNIAFAARLRSTARQDANLNAISSLFSLGHLVSLFLDDDLQELRELFTKS